MSITNDNMGAPPSTASDHTTEGEDHGGAPLRFDLHVPAITFIKLFAALLVGCALWLLGPLLLTVFLALFLAVTLDAFVNWLDSKGIRHGVSLTIVITTLLAVLGVAVALMAPVLFSQVARLTEEIPKLREAALHSLPVNESIRGKLDAAFQSESWTGVSPSMGHYLSAGKTAVEGLTQAVLILVIGLYLLIDGGKTHAWVLAFFPPAERLKLRATSKEISTVIFGYVRGQFITSAIVTIYAFTVLSLLHVPAAFTLAVLAGAFDVLPLLGFIISTIPAVVLALSVSPQTAFLVVGLHLVFHALENYYIVPKVYGKSLRLSTLTVLLGLLAGSVLGGIPGALAALPVIASYEGIERIWLKPFLPDGVVEKHGAQKDREFGEKE